MTLLVEAKNCDGNNVFSLQAAKNVYNLQVNSNIYRINHDLLFSDNNRLALIGEKIYASDRLFEISSFVW